MTGRSNITTAETSGGEVLAPLDARQAVRWNCQRNASVAVAAAFGELVVCEIDAQLDPPPVVQPEGSFPVNTLIRFPLAETVAQINSFNTQG